MDEILKTVGIVDYEVLQTFGEDVSSCSTNQLLCSMVASGSVTFLGPHFATIIQDAKTLPAPEADTWPGIGEDEEREEEDDVEDEEVEKEQA